MCDVKDKKLKSLPILKEKVADFIWTFLNVQRSGIALWTLLPFIISGIIFDPWNTDIIEDLSEGTPYIYPFPVAAFLLLICVGVMIRTKSAVFLMCTLSSALLCAMALKHQGWVFVDEPDWHIFYTLYAFTAFLTFPVIALRPTLSTLAFRATTVFLTIDVLFSIYMPSWSVLAPFFLAYFPSQVSVVVCLMILMTLRMLWKFHKENEATRAQVRAAAPDLMKSVRWKTASLWWPMLVIFGICIYGYQTLQERYVNQPLTAHLNGLGTEQPLEILEGYSVKLPLEGNPSNVEDASKAAVARLSAAQSKAIQNKINQEIKNAGNSKKAIITGVKKSLPQRFPGTGLSDCDLLDVDCYGANIVKRTINSAYRSARRSMIADLNRRLNVLKRSGTASAKDFKKAVDDSFRTFSKETNRRIGDTAMGMRYINWASLIYGILVLFKTLMIVFARVFYATISTAPGQKTEDEDGDRHEDLSKTTRGKMKRVKHKYTLEKNDGYERYFVNFRCCGNNVVDRRRIPQPFTSAIRRIFSKNYVMCEVDLSADQNVTACDIIVDPPAEIVMWDLGDNDEVFIDMHALIGFSSGCTLGRVISLSLGSLIFGRAIYYSVKGPGRIFVKTSSASIAAGDQNASNVMQSSSLIAWQRETRFNVISALTRRDTFFSGYSIRKFGTARHMVIYDTSQKCRVGTGQGIFKMARAFFVPF